MNIPIKNCKGKNLNLELELDKFVGHLFEPIVESKKSCRCVEILERLEVIERKLDENYRSNNCGFRAEDELDKV